MKFFSYLWTLLEAHSRWLQPSPPQERAFHVLWRLQDGFGNFLEKACRFFGKAIIRWWSTKAHGSFEFRKRKEKSVDQYSDKSFCPIEQGDRSQRQSRWKSRNYEGDIEEVWWMDSEKLERLRFSVSGVSRFEWFYLHNVIASKDLMLVWKIFFERATKKIFLPLSRSSKTGFKFERLIQLHSLFDIADLEKYFDNRVPRKEKIQFTSAA